MTAINNAHGTLRRLPLLTLLAALATLAACTKPPPDEVPLRPLQVLKVGAGGAALSELPIRAYSGEVRSRYASLLAFQVGGKIVARSVNAGDNVKLGQVLARLDPADVRLAATQAQASLQQAEADAKRYRDLHAGNFVSRAALDARETTLKAAQSQAALAKNQERYTELRADRNGVVGSVMADIGKVVAPGEVIIRLAPDGDREIAISIPEAEYANFRIGMSAEVSVYALPGQTFKGTVRELSALADPDTRTYPMRVQVNGIEKWPTGLTASVRFPPVDKSSAASTSVAIPLTALYQQGESAAVWIVGADDTVSLRPVEIERFADDAVFLKSGLAQGDQIAAAGVHRLSPGQKVRPVFVTPAIAEGAK